MPSVDDRFEPAQGRASVLDSGLRVISTAQQILLDRIDLVRVEIKSDVRSALTGALGILAGGLMAVLGWVALMVAAVVAGFVPPAVALAVVGGFHLVLGVIAIAWGLRGLGSMEVVPPDSPDREPM